MSTAIYPTLVGLGFTFTKRPIWSTKILTAASGKEYPTSFFSYPRYQYTLIYEVLRAGASFLELQTLMGFFNNRQGSFDNFYFLDPDDNQVTAQAFGTGNGSTRSFQLVHAYGGFVEPIVALNGSPSIYDNGVLQSSGYTITNGVVTFTNAPANTHVLTWTGSFYRVVRFVSDQNDFEKFMQDLWAMKKVELITKKVP